MNCPSCARKLIDVATSCRCGWVKPTALNDPLERQAQIARAVAEQIAEQTARAKAALEEKGLGRKPDETFEEWRQRTMVYVKQQIAGINKAA